jgi:hypothetical protein
LEVRDGGGGYKKCRCRIISIREISGSNLGPNGVYPYVSLDLLQAFQGDAEIEYHLDLKNSLFLSDPSRRQINYSLIIPSLKLVLKTSNIRQNKQM